MPGAVTASPKVLLKHFVPFPVLSASGSFGAEQPSGNLPVTGLEPLTARRASLATTFLLFLLTGIAVPPYFNPLNNFVLNQSLFCLEHPMTLEQIDRLQSGAHATTATHPQKV